MPTKKKFSVLLEIREVTRGNSRVKAAVIKMSPVLALVCVSKKAGYTATAELMRQGILTAENKEFMDGKIRRSFLIDTLARQGVKDAVFSMNPQADYRFVDKEQ